MTSRRLPNTSPSGDLPSGAARGSVTSEDARAKETRWGLETVVSYFKCQLEKSVFKYILLLFFFSWLLSLSPVSWWVVLPSGGMDTRPAEESWEPAPGPSTHTVATSVSSKKPSRLETELHELKLHKDLIVFERTYFPVFFGNNKIWYGYFTV